jgi:mono/diheme cytochrome c family protein
MWNNLQSGAQTDATLVAEDGVSLAVPGSSPAQTWRFPSRSECKACHTPAGGFALGFNTRQMNRSHVYGAQTQNQIAALSSAGYFSSPVTNVANLPALARADDATASLEWKVRSYFAANCAQCHQPGGTALGNWDARPTTATDAAGMINGLLVNSFRRSG